MGMEGETVTLPADLADLYLSVQAHEAHAKAVKARVLDAMGNAQYGTHADTGQRIDFGVRPLFAWNNFNKSNKCNNSNKREN